MGLLDGLLGEQGSDQRLKLKMGLMGLTHRPNQQLMAQWGGELQQSQATKAEAAKVNKTAQYLRSLGTAQAMQAAAALEAGSIDANTAYAEATRQAPVADPWAGTKVVGGDVLRMGPNGPEVVYSDPAAAGGDAPTYGLTPQRYVRPDGTIGLGVLGNDGTFKEVALPEGAQPAPNVDKIDAGDRWILMDQQGNKIGEELKNLRAAEAEKALGQAQGAAEAAAASDISAAEAALGYIDSLEKHPGRMMGTGASSWTGYVPGSQSREFQIEVERLKSGAFMTAIQQLRGMGALSNAEGQTATAAVAALATEGTEAGFLKRLNEYKAMVKLGLDRAKSRIGQPASDAPAPTPEAPAVTTRRLRYNPATGALE